MILQRPKILGILNLTEDSFSDGSLYLKPVKALKQANYLIESGAEILDLGAEASHPNAKKISAQEEIDRILPILRLLRPLKKQGIQISVDTYKPKVIERVLQEGTDFINDITALSHEESIELLANSSASVILMFSKYMQNAKAGIQNWNSLDPFEEILPFFESKIEILLKKGIRKNQIILDPGMGFFLSSHPKQSLRVLKNISRLKSFQLAILVSPSRKSFIGEVLQEKDSQNRDIGTLAAELWLGLERVDYIRSHHPKNLSQCLTMLEAIQTV